MTSTRAPELSPGRTGTIRWFHRRVARLWISVFVIVVLAVVAFLLFHPRPVSGDGDLAGTAVLTASSSAPGSSPRNAVDTASTAGPGADWQSAGQTAGAWLEFTWSQTHVLRKIVLVRNPLDDPGVTGGFLSFGDGSDIQVRLSTTSRTTVIPFTPRTVSTFRFTASTVSAGAASVIISEIVVSALPSSDDVTVGDSADGNAAGDATLQTDSDHGASDPKALQDGSGAAGVAGTGAVWTVSDPVGAWVQLDWARPRELTSLQVVGSTTGGSRMAGGTLTFSDGSQLPVGAVLGDPAHPTTIGFMPRVVRSVRLTIDKVDGRGSLGLAELRAYQRGSTPVGAAAQQAAMVGVAADTTCDTSTPATGSTGLVVRCPGSGSSVEGNVLFDLAAPPGYSTVAATVWPADGALAPAKTVTASLDADGAGTLTVNVDDAPRGPFTVAFSATGPGVKASTVYFQLYRNQKSAAPDLPGSDLAKGRTLVYDDEFDRPITVSRSGEHSDYAGTKPLVTGGDDFGDAVFTGDEQGQDNLQVVDNSYLRIGVEPTPNGYVDPQGYARSYVGGLLASARSGGSGFSAQYGYFEARMLAPAAMGTWPSFWMLPSDNLIASTPTVAEIDAVEIYGFNPTATCQSTHQYEAGKPNAGTASCKTRFATPRAALAWHTYGVSILPTGNTFYIDGKSVASAPQVRGGDAPMFFMLDLALGGGWPVNLTGVQGKAALYVDYVRVYV